MALVLHGRSHTLVSVALAAAGDGTDLLLTHDDLPEEGVASHAGGWGQIVGRLDQWLSEGR